MTRLLNSLFAIAWGMLSLGASTAFAAHELLYAVTADNDLISFYSDAPGSILTNTHAIIGLRPAEEIRGIDYWPADQKIYALGSSSQLYTINPTTGAATQVGAGSFGLVLNGQSFGVDNGPAGFYVVSDQHQSLVISRTTGMATLQPSLSYAAGDAFAGQSPFITALAYDSAAGTWYAGDSLKNTLATLNPATGVLSTIKSSGVGIDFSRANGADISPDTRNMYLASPAASSAPAANLYTVNKVTGVVTLVGLIGNPGDNILVRGLTVASAGS